ncbi:MAG: hypothetical protein KME04_07785 [Pleurocapsa minor GSE-CHR-MK-17-07R]|jgi:hypothetical protein|nr:hypothetical protein [Pleurocapsa minor GSE-CHR-MK 17-07R]
MNLPIILAHGALGAFDEIIFIAAAVLFATLMGVAWWRARGDVVIDELADEESPAAQPMPTSPEAPDRFKLE